MHKNLELCSPPLFTGENLWLSWKFSSGAECPDEASVWLLNEFIIVSNTIKYICNICFSCSRNQMLEAWMDTFKEDESYGSRMFYVFSISLH